MRTRIQESREGAQRRDHPSVQPQRHAASRRHFEKKLRQKTFARRESLYRKEEISKASGARHSNQNPGAPEAAGRISGAFTPKRRCAKYVCPSDMRPV